MKHLACLLLLPALALAADPPKLTVVAKDVPGVHAICVTPDGRTFVADTFGGKVVEIKKGESVKVADVEVAQDLVAYQQWLYVTSPKGVYRIDTATGALELWADIADFPGKQGGCLGIAADERGGISVFTVTAGTDEVHFFTIGVKPGPRGKPPARGDIKEISIDKSLDYSTVLCDGLNHRIGLKSRAADSQDPKKYRMQITRFPLDGGKSEPVAILPSTGGHVWGKSLCADSHGRVFILNDSAVFGIPRPGAEAVKVADLNAGYDGLAYHPVTKQLLIGNKGEKTVYSIPAVIPGWEVDESPLAVEAVPAFADVKWTGWDDGSSSGKVVPFRPIVLTHANDASGRTFVATQHGVIHVIEKGAKESKVFLDIQGKCLYRDDQNEQGLLGLAFHPDYKKTGEFFVFYTDKKKALENVVCRFKVSKDDPNKADPASEQELMRISHKYWNHDGGTLTFGPDGFLYVVLGDGGSANDPDDHGQKTDVLLGKILRIDINAKGDTTPYAIPKDNPFVGQKEYRPEIFALGVRNPWRMSFDRKTGQGWFGEVGQNLWEEINLLEKGANYGWRRRESLHPFGADGTGPKKEFTDPVWEYHHEVGKSITGGHVYRGKEVPALEGHYLYADYVSTKVWALKYDDKGKRVTANRPVSVPKLAWLSFGEDEAGEVYVMTYAANGKGIHKFKAGK